MVDCMVDTYHISAITTRFAPKDWCKKIRAGFFRERAGNFSLRAVFFCVEALRQYGVNG